MESFLHVIVALQSAISISGPGDSYEGVASSMKRAYLKVVMSHGGQEAFDTILQRLPLSPQDFHVTGLASEIAGWSESFLERPSAKSSRAKAKTNQGQQGQGATICGHWAGIDVSCCKAQSSSSTSSTPTTTDKVGSWCCSSSCKAPDAADHMNVPEAKAAPLAPSGGTIASCSATGSCSASGSSSCGPAA